MRVIALAMAMVAALWGGLAMAEDGTGETPEIAALKAVLADGPLDENLFAASFLAALPKAQLEEVTAGVKAAIGPVTAVTARGGQDYLVETATHEMESKIALDGEGRIAGLLFGPPISKNADIGALIGEMGAMAPDAAVLVMADGAVLHAVNADAPLAVGSAFKLGVLKALNEQIGAGRHSWDEVVTLAEADRSLPSGILQGWPEGMPMTLASLASLMISISDNTATDVLMRIVGRDAVEAALGIAPALTTRELFVLKADRDAVARYVAGDVDEKRAVLAEIAAHPLPDPSALTPHDVGAEWYVPAERLCELIEAVAALPPMQINPGVAARADWQDIAFKGGSEIGVLNLTTRVTGKDGTRYCVVASWNDTKAIDETRATGAYASLLAALARE